MEGLLKSRGEQELLANTDQPAPVNCLNPHATLASMSHHRCRTQSSGKNDKLWADLEKNALSSFVEGKDKRKAVQARQAEAPSKGSAQQQWAAALGERWARTLYAYFNYRTGSVNDLQLLILLNISIILVGGALRHFLVVKDLPGGATPTLGQDLYRVRAARLAPPSCGAEYG
jgi:hypothetical protein